MSATPLEPFRVAALQMVSTPDRERNLAEAEKLIAEAAAAGARLVLLPEYFCFMGHKDSEKLAIREPHGDGPIQRFLADAAKRHGVWVIGDIDLQRIAAVRASLPAWRHRVLDCA